MPATAKVIVLKGDPRNPESAEHIILFPGGSIAVTRTSKNEYWAHIEVNHPEAGMPLLDSTRESAYGVVTEGRVDRAHGVEDLDTSDLRHIAIRIKTKTSTEGEGSR